MQRHFKIVVFILWFMVKVTPVSFSMDKKASSHEKSPINNVILPSQKGKNKSDETIFISPEDDFKSEQPISIRYKSYKLVKRNYSQLRYVSTHIPQNYSPQISLFLKNCIWRI